MSIDAFTLGCFFYLENFAEVVEKVEVEEDYEKLAEELVNASPLEIMDKALEKFGSDIAIAFRYIFSHTLDRFIFLFYFNFLGKNILLVY